MKCKFCREELPEGAKFCPVCGTPAEPETEENQERDDAWDEAVTGWQGANSYQYDTSEQEQNPYQYGPQGQGQNPYQYGSPNQGQDSYQYNPSNQGGNPYQYGSSNQEPRGQYQYGSSNQGNYQYGPRGQGGNPYQYDSPNQGDYQYGPSSQEQYRNNSGAPSSGTPYMILAIFTILMCCMPLGIVAIIYASRINGLLRNGDYAGARESAKKVKLFSIIGIIGGLISMTFLLIFNLSDLQDGLLSSPRVTISERADRDEDESMYGDEEDNEESAEKAVVTEPAEQSSELGETWDTYTVQINDKVLTFPCTYGELEAAGLALDTSDTPEDYIVNANEYVMVFFEDANDNYVMVDLINNTDNAKTIKECLVGGISVSDYGVSEGGITILFPGGLKIGSTREEMLAKYGNTDDIYEGDSLCIYTWTAENSYYSQCEMDLDAETGLINSMNIQNYGE